MAPTATLPPPLLPAPSARRSPQTPTARSTPPPASRWVSGVHAGGLALRYADLCELSTCIASLIPRSCRIYMPFVTCVAPRHTVVPPQLRKLEAVSLAPATGAAVAWQRLQRHRPERHRRHRLCCKWQPGAWRDPCEWHRQQWHRSEPKHQQACWFCKPACYASGQYDTIACWCAAPSHMAFAASLTDSMLPDWHFMYAALRTGQGAVPNWMSVSDRTKLCRCERHSLPGSRHHAAGCGSQPEQWCQHHRYWPLMLCCCGLSSTEQLLLLHCPPRLLVSRCDMVPGAECGL